ncbi:ABC transporter permease [Actinacidiphila paucisporea]|uniref:Transport permease protein n=1 Tax=Actinacidiphila paucisporea TaxID=310782 RepID=A0A1M7CNB7_9ACTN|nr:ABC transporter permease [Actinacidiphila paucisporea]SHL68657.1 ABC-2 type transport system permease protein [Actinacidiphila paucisporea]
MSASTPAGPVPPATDRGPVLGRLALTELKLFVRERVGPVFAVGLPLALLVVFGNLPFYNEHRDDLDGFTLLDVYVPILSAFVLAMLSFTVMPQVLAGYREKGVLRRLRTTPVGPARVLAAQLLVNLATAAVSVAAVLLVARFAFGVALPRRLGGYLISIALAALALLAIGLFVAAASPNGRIANAVGATLFYVMMFFAGLFLPIAAMPPLLRHISRAAPLGAAVQALTDATEGHSPHPLQLATLAAYALVFGAGAMRSFRWE